MSIAADASILETAEFGGGRELADMVCSAHLI